MKLKTMLLLVLFAAQFVFAENYVVINSKSGLDVLSGIYYANSIGVGARFMPYNGDYRLTAGKVGTGKDILLIQSASMPVTTFLENELKKSNKVTVYSVTSDGFKTNLDLAGKSGVNSFIIVDPSFGQNAISVISYAKRTKSYVIFAYSGNIDSVIDFLDKKQSPKVTIFGYVDSATRKKLEKYSPIVIGKGEDKYEDNIELVSKMASDYGLKQAIMADGTFIEEGMVDGNLPVVLVAPIIPDVTYGFVLESARKGTLNSYILVGSNLISPTYDLKKKVQAKLQEEGRNRTLSIIVKFGQSVAGVEGTYPLDTFPVPSYILGMSIDSLKYNKATGKIELEITSKAEGPEYYQVEIHIKKDGTELSVLGDSKPSLIERGETKGLEYDYALPSVEEGKITGDVIVRYGETQKSLTAFTAKSVDIATYSFVDRSDVVVAAASYKDGDLRVSIRNTGEQDAYVQASAGLIVGGAQTTIRSASATKVPVGSIAVVALPVDLSARDLEANKEVKITLKYGAREGFLQKTKESTVPLSIIKEEKGIDPLMIGLIILVIILLIVVIYFATRRSGTGKVEEHEAARKKR
ncbi:MAG: hypothetical protein N3G76_03175 [Candidatus Micrarchaeota archaeon]|nr:hypothetical protein [Candidatus Micrarchaeota archaeon]